MNLYGPGDNFDPLTSHVIPALVRKCVESVRGRRDRIVCWGTGAPTREFLHVRDCVNGIVQAATTYEEAAPVNLGIGTETSIRELAERIARLTGFTGVIEWDASQPDGQPRRTLDTHRARERLGWGAQIGLDEGLLETIAYFREVHQPNVS